MAGLCHYICCQCCSNRGFYHTWNLLVLCEIIRMYIWIFDYQQTIRPLKVEYGVGRIGLTVGYVYFGCLCCTFLMYILSLCARTRTSLKYCVVFSHKLMLWLTFFALFADNILYLVNKKYYCPEVDELSQRQPENVFDDLDKDLNDGKRLLSMQYQHASAFDQKPKSQPTATAHSQVTGHAPTEQYASPTMDKSMYQQPLQPYQQPAEQTSAYRLANQPLHIDGVGGPSLYDPRNPAPLPKDNFWNWNQGAGQLPYGVPQTLSYCPEDKVIDMTTLWVFDGVFLLLLLPIWFKANSILSDYAEEAANEEPQVFNDDEEIEMEDSSQV